MDALNTVRSSGSAVSLWCRDELERDKLTNRWQVVAEVAQEKNLAWHGRPKAVMYIEDFLEYARVFLSTTEVKFHYGWSRVQALLFCHLLAITGSRPGALLQLRYRDISLSLLQVSASDSRPRLIIRLRLVNTKRFRGPKPMYVSFFPFSFWFVGDEGRG